MVPTNLELSPRPPEWGSTGIRATEIVGKTFEGLKVTVENSGDRQITDLRVEVVLRQPGRWTKKVATIDVINPGGQTKVVRFGGWGPVKFAVPSRFVVRSVAVSGEVNRTNNRTVLPVVFTIP